MNPNILVEATQPRLLDEVEILLTLPRADSTAAWIADEDRDKLAGLNAARFTEWTRPFNEDNARPAIYAFNGDVYAGLDAESMTHEEVISATAT